MQTGIENHHHVALSGERWPFTRVIAPFRYDFPINWMIHQLKYGGQPGFARLLAEWLIEKILQYYNGRALPDAVIPVPLHTSRLRERGFNQSLEIARPIARRLNIPVDFHSCRRIRATHTQTALSLPERKSNIQNAFAVTGFWSGARIALVDDVLTTGYTMSEMTKVFQQAGVAEVHVWVLAQRTEEETLSQEEDTSWLIP